MTGSSAIMTPRQTRSLAATRLAMPARIGCALAISLVCATSQAVGWEPTEPVEFVVPAGTGGGADQMARFIQKMVVDHRLTLRNTSTRETLQQLSCPSPSLHFPCINRGYWSDGAAPLNKKKTRVSWVCRNSRPAEVAPTVFGRRIEEEAAVSGFEAANT